MELKFKESDDLANPIVCFNRTFMELKLRLASES